MYSHPLGSDKHYWHRYSDLFYSNLLGQGGISNVLEFGTYRGDSVRWLSEILPEARIWSVDIVPENKEWPSSDLIRYHTIDQGDREGIRRFLEETGVLFDLVIEDGSHLPIHQANSLFETIHHMAEGGVYVIEDIHSSVEELRGAGLISPAKLGFGRRFSKPKKKTKLMRRFSNVLLPSPIPEPLPQPCVNLFSLCLALERVHSLGRELNDSELEQLTSDGFLKKSEILRIADRLRLVEICRRTTLPLACHGCLSDQSFNYATLSCECGERLYKDDDSIAAILHF